MNSWFSRRPVVWDVTAPRALAAAGRADLLFSVTGLWVPRTVADPADPQGDALLNAAPGDLSELAAAEQHFRHRHRRLGDAEDYDRAVRMAAVRSDPNLRVLDLSAEELDDMRVLESPGFRQRLGHVLPLGRGERAALAVAANRELIAGLDDAAARAAADDWGVPTMTTQDLLRAAVAGRVISDRVARAVNDRLLAEGFYGEPDL